MSDKSTVRATVADTGDYEKDADTFARLYEALERARLGPYIDYDNSKYGDPAEDHSMMAQEEARDAFVDCEPGKERATAERVKGIARRLRILSDVQVSHIAL